MTRLEFFEKGYAQIAVSLGIMSASRFGQFIQFKDYALLREAGYSKKQAIKITAQRMKCSRSTVWRSVQFFE